MVAHPKGCPSENVMALMDYQEGTLLFCINKNGENLYLTGDEIGEVLGNISTLNEHDSL